ncbi:hypothetical protein MSC49_01830 [Methylosinus sp. C49]|uniref:hypothetical protein n=1 Tax=Methylosinus sp. C49 TaxID=2699395 RepID=UPI001366D453|nr:hypothetical protein [Methylosinus sp. C49]BBU60248.1 hypothetical protein MSC49_01830 [Methylosinus sp. C49]
MELPSRERLSFLYRTEEGRLDRAGWSCGAAGLVAALVPLTLIWLALFPYTDHDLAKDPFFVWQTVAAYAYLTFYALAILLIAVSFVNLSAKRFRALDRPAPLLLAGLLPFAALVAGAMHWLQPRVAEVMPYWPVALTDLALAAVALWVGYELGVREGGE